MEALRKIEIPIPKVRFAIGKRRQIQCTTIRTAISKVNKFGIKVTKVHIDNNHESEDYTNSSLFSLVISFDDIEQTKLNINRFDEYVKEVVGIIHSRLK